MFLRIVTVDMDGFCGRDRHPGPEMVGEVVRVVRSWSEDEIAVYTCWRSCGALVDLVEFEVEPIDEPLEGPFVIGCRVSGGVTGTRESVVKADGVVRRFGSRALAALEAAYLSSTANGPYATATFSYWPEEAI